MKCLQIVKIILKNPRRAIWEKNLLSFAFTLDTELCHSNSHNLFFRFKIERTIFTISEYCLVVDCWTQGPLCRGVHTDLCSCVACKITVQGKQFIWLPEKASSLWRHGKPQDFLHFCVILFYFFRVHISLPFFDLKDMYITYEVIPL